MAENIVSSLKQMRKEPKTTENSSTSQTYEEFVRDPEGVEYKAKQMILNPEIRQAKNNEKINSKVMKKLIETGEMQVGEEEQSSIWGEENQ